MVKTILMKIVNVCIYIYLYAIRFIFMENTYRTERKFEVPGKSTHVRLHTDTHGEHYCRVTDA
jgi:hypothetical protein